MADPQHELKEWLANELKRHGRGATQMLAAHLGVKPHYVSRMKNLDGSRQMRRIDAHIVPVLARYFDSVPPGYEIIAEIRCKTDEEFAKYFGSGGDGTRAEAVTNTPKEINTIKIITPHQGTLVVGNNNTIITHNNQTEISGAPLSAEQALKLDSAVRSVSSARKSDPSQVWQELCAALSIPDSALITRDTFDNAVKILARWNGGAIRDAVNNIDKR